MQLDSHCSYGGGGGAVAAVCAILWDICTDLFFCETLKKKAKNSILFVNKTFECLTQ